MSAFAEMPLSSSAPAPGLSQTSQSNYHSFSNTPETASDPEPDDAAVINPTLHRRRFSTAADAPLPPHIAEPDATVKIIYTILGAATLLPWNGAPYRLTFDRSFGFTDFEWMTVAIITVTPWYMLRMKGSPIQPAFVSYVNVSCQTSNFVALAHATATVKSVRPRDLRPLPHNLTIVSFSSRRPRHVAYE